MNSDRRNRARSIDEKVYMRRLAGKLPSDVTQLRLIDLFAGAGGLTLGFTELLGHSFVPVWANDFDKSCVDTYNLNFGDHCVCGDINEILTKRIARIPRAEVVIGGPPCQGFSLLNKQRDNDPRRQLWRPFFEIVRMSRAEVFLMENVPQLLGSEEFTQIIALARAMGFNVASGKLCAADYGVAQTRWRAFILGCKFADPNEVFPPKKSHYNVNNGHDPSLFDGSNEYISRVMPWRTVRDAIGSLPSPYGIDIRSEAPPLDIHFGRTPSETSIRRYRIVAREGMNRFDLQRIAPELTPKCWIRKTSGGTDLFGRLWWDKPAFTIRTEFFKPEKGRYLHPSEHRPITHREAARLQSFPDSFKFIGTKIQIARQIGNAVPPLLAARVADSIVALFSMKAATNDRQTHNATKKPPNVSGQRTRHRARTAGA